MAGYTGGALPLLVEARAAEPAFHLFLRIVVCHTAAASTGDAAAHQDKAWTRLFSGYIPTPRTRARAVVAGMD